MQFDPRVDAYLATQPPFALAILERVRAAMALACPEASETIKWGRPFWTLAGKPVAMMSGFKAHATFGVWRPPGSTAPGRAEAGWDRVADAAELAETAVLADALRAALATVASAPIVKTSRPPTPAAKLPEDLAAAFAAAGGAAQFAAFPPGAQADYIAWITEAKRPDTRARRVAEAAAWIAQGKRRNWRYERC